MTEKLPFLDITLLVLILLSISALGFMFIVWLLRRKYARNRFAFAGLSAIVFLSMTILSSLPFRSTPWDVVGTLFAYTFNVPYVPSEPRLVDYIFVLLVLSIVVYVILQLYKNWDGQITVEQYSREARYEPTTLVADGLDEIKRLLQRSPPPPIHQPTEVRPLESTLIPADESLAWHIRACDLVSLRTPSYTFVRHEDWHEQHRSWIGYNRRTDALVGIFCVNEDPSTHDIDTFVNYARRMARNQKRNQNEIELIIALEQSESIDPVEVYDTVPVGLSVPMLAMQLLGLGIGFSAMGASRSTAIMRRRIQLWYACCKALDIDDRNISNQFGKSTVEGIRRSLSDVQS